MSVIIRNPNNSEIPMLRNILCKTFGQDGQGAFLDRLYSKERGIVAQADGEIVSMGYLIPMGELDDLSCAMIYAVATLPAWRGRGLGAKITNELISLAYDLSFGCVVLCPFEDSLFDFYGKCTQMRDCFYVRETVTGPLHPAKERSLSEMCIICAQEYSEKRETLLKDIPHIKQQIDCIEFQIALCDEMGGGLFKIDDSCAVIEVQSNGDVWIKELLISAGDDEERIKKSICNRFPAEKYVFRTPAKQEGSRKRFGMLTCKNEENFAGFNNDYMPWYGLAFD